MTVPADAFEAWAKAELGLAGMGRPDNFLRRQVGRWLTVRREQPTRDLPEMDRLGNWRLAVIVEGAYGLYLAGKVDMAYARGLERDVPALLHEAALAAQGDW